MPLDAHHFVRHIRTWVRADETVLLASSGGMDSMVLAHLLLSSGQPFEIAHMNYGLRGRDSDLDEQFIRRFCKKHGLVFHHRKVQLGPRKSAIQEQARTLRYEWFSELLSQRKLSFVLTAHHMNDQAETMLFRFIRGSGAEGLAGMDECRERLLRPLLGWDRQDLESYAKLHRVKWREDVSNTELRYKRNLIRHKLLPLAAQINPGVIGTLARHADVYRESARLVQQESERMLKELIMVDGSAESIRVSTLEHHPFQQLVLFEWLRKAGFSSGQIYEVRELLHSISGARVSSDSHQVSRDRDRLLLSPLHHQVFAEASIPLSDGEITSPVYLKFRSVPSPGPISPDPLVAQLDLDRLTFPLIVRPWKSGDRFIPLGMSRHRKVSDFLIGQKVPLIRKKELCVVESGGEICWIVGYRIAHPFRVTPDTRAVFEIRSH